MFLFLFFSLPLFWKFPRSPLKRRLRRAFWPPGPPKAFPRSTRGLPRRSRFHLSAQMLVLFCVFGKERKRNRHFFIFFAINCIFLSKAASGSLPERPKRHQKAPKSAPGGSKRASRDPKSRSKGLKKPKSLKSLPRRPQDFPKHFDRQPFSEKWKNSNCKSSQESSKKTPTRFSEAL